jgi:hypothetical protein
MPGKCFVMMPFRDPFNQHYETLLGPSIKAVGLEPVRANEIYGVRPIVDNIFREIMEATALIADVTSKNPNVNYELGIAHTLKRPVVIISQSMDDVPFDYLHYRVYLYDVAEPAKLAPKIQRALEEIQRESQGIADLLGRWEGWYRECDETEWHPTAHEIQVKGAEIAAVAYGVTNQSDSLCTDVSKDQLGKCKMIWTYESRVIRGRGGLADHTGTHIAFFTHVKGAPRLMEGRYFNDREQRNKKSRCMGAVGEFNCEWVSAVPRQGLFFDSSEWPKNRATAVSKSSPPVRHHD